ncbi:hypothetical protein BJ508DRAFT_314828 [Ascobolus immersus RN42]|uniref:Uncharacterized protein n=1 Tax=Ascobolus immersus RN42 TaxID=1160509 RepID=A0A3N4HGX5_ASCIM|nr:hypothetical protein BJ508DRAFT_314828 [Ascobolus immersus RN42]
MPPKPRYSTEPIKPPSKDTKGYAAAIAAGIKKRRTQRERAWSSKAAPTQDTRAERASRKISKERAKIQRSESPEADPSDETVCRSRFAIQGQHIFLESNKQGLPSDANSTIPSYSCPADDPCHSVFPEFIRCANLDCSVALCCGMKQKYKKVGEKKTEAEKAGMSRDERKEARRPYAKDDRGFVIRDPERDRLCGVMATPEVFSTAAEEAGYLNFCGEMGDMSVNEIQEIAEKERVLEMEESKKW